MQKCLILGPILVSMPSYTGPYPSIHAHLSQSIYIKFAKIKKWHTGAVTLGKSETNLWIFLAVLFKINKNL